MKKLLTTATILICFIANSQCEKKTIEKEDYLYEGCINYEGKPDGDGFEYRKIEGQVQEKTGVFKNGHFIKGVFITKFKNGDIRTVNYLDYENKKLSNEKYEFSNGNKKVTTYKSGNKVKEIESRGPGDLEGLVIETIYLENKTIEIKNIENNRVPEDIIGVNAYIDINLEETNNQFRIPIKFPTKDGKSLAVSIQFDTGAQDLLIGNKLYQELLKKCEVVDLNVKSKGLGVGGEFEFKYIQIKEIKIGDYLIKNVVAMVPDKDKSGEYINDMLIGIGFLKKFKEVKWSLNNSKMRFFK